MAQTQYSWAVTSQVTGQVVNDDAGNTIVGSYIYFTTGNGNKGSVFVPDNLQGNETYVKSAIRAQAKLLDDIGNYSQSYAE